jgi:hypothetical protein
MVAVVALRTEVLGLEFTVRTHLHHALVLSMAALATTLVGGQVRETILSRGKKTTDAIDQQFL